MRFGLVDRNLSLPSNSSELLDNSSPTSKATTNTTAMKLLTSSLMEFTKT